VTGKWSATFLAALLVLLPPFGEGGRSPLALAVGQLLVLGFLFVAVARAGTVRAGLRPAFAAVAAILLLALFSTAGAGYRYAALLGLMDRLAIAAAFAGALLHFGDREGLLRLRQLLVLSCVLQAACALGLAAAGGLQNAARIFANRSQLGAFLAFGLALSAGALFEEQERGSVGRRIWLVATAIQALALILLQSRGALLGAAAAASALLWVHGAALSTRGRAFAAVVILAILGTGGLALQRRFASSEDPDRYTRVAIWEAALRMTAERPWLGFGPGQFPHEAPRFNFPLDRSPVRFGRGFRGAHSLPLTFAAEGGVPAAALAILLGLGIPAVLLNRGRRGGEPGALVAGAGAAILALATQGCVEDLQERPAILLAAALLAGSALACARPRRPDEPPPVRVGVGRAALAATALLGVWIAASGVVFPYLGWREAETARALGKEGLPHMRRAAALVPGDAAPHRDLAMAELQEGPPDAKRYAAAAIDLDAARSAAPRDAMLALLRARLEAIAATRIFPGGGAAARAAALYDEAAGLAPTDPRPRFEAAGYFDTQGLHEEAIDRLRGALRLEPHYRRARLALIDLLVRAGREDEARREASELGRSDVLLRDYVPDSPYAREITADDPARRASIPPNLLAASL
jgi:O-antigen ligase